jgi:hypothetical protein
MLAELKSQPSGRFHSTGQGNDQLHLTQPVRYKYGQWACASGQDRLPLGHALCNLEQPGLPFMAASSVNNERGAAQRHNHYQPD